MKIDKNSYELKSYIINKQSELASLLITEEDSIEKYGLALAVINDIQKICDKRKRY